MIVGMTGSRYGISPKASMQLELFLLENDIKEVHHGDCVGADTHFHNEAVSQKIKTVVHPPNIKKLRSFCQGDVTKKPLPYLVRNRNIVNGSDMLIAFPSTKHEVIRSGTWYTIRYAIKMKKKIMIVFSDGDTKILN